MELKNESKEEDKRKFTKWNYFFGNNRINNNNNNNNSNMENNQINSSKLVLPKIQKWIPQKHVQIRQSNWERLLIMISK